MYVFSEGGKILIYLYEQKVHGILQSLLRADINFDDTLFVMEHLIQKSNLKKVVFRRSLQRKTEIAQSKPSTFLFCPQNKNTHFANLLMKGTRPRHKKNRKQMFLCSSEKHFFTQLKLQFAQGLKVTILQIFLIFEQKPRLKPCVNRNTNKREATDNMFFKE